jgi:hypothetical protein
VTEGVNLGRYPTSVSGRYGEKEDSCFLPLSQSMKNGEHLVYFPEEADFIGMLRLSGHLIGFLVHLTGHQCCGKTGK